LNRPAILIYAVRPDNIVLKEILAGIEEEGVLCQVVMRQDDTMQNLSIDAAGDSALGSGIGILENTAALSIRFQTVQEPMFQITSSSANKARILGANAARAVKKIPFQW